MGKNKKSTILIEDKFMGQTVNLDSLEEWQVYHWVMELHELGVIKNYEYQPAEFQLTTKYQYVPVFNNLKKKKYSLLQSHEYTSDFKLTCDIKYGETLAKYFKISQDMIKDDEITLYIDVKGAFQQNGGARTFSINQKMTYEKYGIYVQKVVPQDLFHTLGIPLRCLQGYKGRPSKMYVGYKFAKTVFGKYT